MFTNILFKQFLPCFEEIFLSRVQYVNLHIQRRDRSFVRRNSFNLGENFYFENIKPTTTFFSFPFTICNHYFFFKIFLVTHLQKNILCHIRRKSEAWQRFVSGFVTWMIYNDMQIFFQPSTDKRFSRLIAADIRP